ncbi:MAG: hypothetical protein ABW167_20090 [Baekduia sp.]
MSRAPTPPEDDLGSGMIRTHQELLDAIAGTLPQGVEEPPRRLRRITAALTELARIARLLREIFVTITSSRLRAALTLLAIAGIAAVTGLGTVAERVGSNVIRLATDDPAIGQPAAARPEPEGVEAGRQPVPCLPALTPRPASRQP